MGRTFFSESNSSHAELLVLLSSTRLQSVALFDTYFQSSSSTELLFRQNYWDFFLTIYLWTYVLSSYSGASGQTKDISKSSLVYKCKISCYHGKELKFDEVNHFFPEQWAWKASYAQKWNGRLLKLSRVLRYNSCYWCLVYGAIADPCYSQPSSSWQP